MSVKAKVKKINNGGSAFPYCQWYGDSHAGHTKGMSLRDWFAGQIISGMFANPTIIGVRDGVGLFSDTNFKMAYKAADAMIAESIRNEMDEVGG